MSTSFILRNIWDLASVLHLEVPPDNAQDYSFAW
jgi:hypothetical protein